MKKIFSILMIFILIFTMTGCNKNETETVVETDSIINKIETTTEEVNITVEGDFLETDSLSAEKVIEEENILGLDISLDSNVENDEYTVSIENITTNEDTEVYVVENNNQVKKEAEVEDNKVNYNHSTVTPVIIDNTSTTNNSTATTENNNTTVEEVAQKIEETKTENKTEQKTETKTVTWSDWKKTDEKVTKEATTTSTGTKVITYTRTSSDGQTQTKTETQTIAKLANSPANTNSSSNNNTSSGNTSSGSTTNNNTNNSSNNNSSSSTKPAHSHSYGSWKNNSSQHWKECSCGDISNRSNHTFGSWAVVKQATTTETGKKERSCTTCGYKETENIPKVTSSGNNNSGSNNNNSGNNNNNNTSHSHSYGSWTVKTAATCTNSGTEARKCSCGKEETRTIAAKGHTWMFSRTVEPTTTSEGYDLYLCTECGKQEKRNIKAKLVHSHTWIHAYDGENMTRTYKCSCGESKTVQGYYVVDVPYQAAVYEERQVERQRQVWWITYSQFKDNERQWSNPSYHTTLTFYTKEEAVSSGNYWKSLNQFVGSGMYGENYYTTETVLVKAEVPEQGHWEYPQP